MESEQQNTNPPKSGNIFKSWRNSLLGRFSSSSNGGSSNSSSSNNNNQNSPFSNNSNSANHNSKSSETSSSNTTNNKNKRSSSSSAASSSNANSKSSHKQPPKQTHPALVSSSSGSNSNNTMSPSATNPTSISSSTPNPNSNNASTTTTTPPSSSSSSSPPPSSASTPFPWSMGPQAYKAVHPHHASLSALWNQKWKFPCTKSLYPFHDGQYEDFEPVFLSLIKLAAEERDVGVLAGIHSGLGKQYTEAFFGVAGELEGKADRLLLKGKNDGGEGAMDERTRKDEASKLYLRAAAVLRIARFPYIGPDVSGRWGRGEREGDDDDDDDDDESTTIGENKKLKKEKTKFAASSSTIRANPVPASIAKQGEASKWEAWTSQKRVYMKAGSLWDSPVQEILVPHRYGVEGRDLAGDIPVYIRFPSSSPLPTTTSSVSASSASHSSSPTSTYSTASASNNNKPPPYQKQQQQQRKQQQHPTVLLLTGLDGYRPDNTVRCDEFLSRGWAVIVAEIPGTADCPADPSDPESGDRIVDSLLAWMEEDTDGRGFDTSRLLAWGLSAGGYHAVRLAHTHHDKFLGVVAQGAGVHHFFDPEWIDRAEGHEYPFALAPAMARKHGFGSVEEYREGVQRKFSLLELGVLSGRSTRLLLVNGNQDGLMPIEDSLMLFSYGSPKEGRFFPGALHMGYPLANSAVYPWMEQAMGWRK